MLAYAIRTIGGRPRKQAFSAPLPLTGGVRMVSVMKARKATVVALLAAMGFAVTGLPAEAQQKSAARGCIDYSNDPAGCQPSTFATPTRQIPSRRVGKDGKLNARSTEAEARAGAARIEKALHLFRNIE